MKIVIKNEVKEVLNTIEKNGFEAYIVGGCVRDYLLNKVPKDWDVTTSAKPVDLLEIFKKYKVIPTGLKHGTVTVVIEKYPVEITTFRIDGEYKDNRRPENVVFTSSLKEDLSRRDFTINAMAYNQNIGLVDFFGGKKDLENRIIRCVGIAKERFSEDALRMMRAIRFSAQLDFTLDNSIPKAIFELLENLKSISKERIRDEFLKTLDSNKPKKVKLYFDNSLIKFVIPNKYKDYNNKRLEFILDTLDYLCNLKSKIYIKLALIFIVYENDNNRLPVDILHKTLKYLRLDNQTIKKTEILYKELETELIDDYKKIKILLNRIGKDNFEDLLLLKNAIISTKGRLLIKSEKTEIFYRVKLIYNNIEMRRECYNIKHLNINGNDLIRMGFKENKYIGKLLRDLLLYVIDNPDKNKKNILEEYILKSYHKNYDK